MKVIDKKSVGEGVIRFVHESTGYYALFLQYHASYDKSPILLCRSYNKTRIKLRFRQLVNTSQSGLLQRGFYDCQSIKSNHWYNDGSMTQYKIVKTQTGYVIAQRLDPAMVHHRPIITPFASYQDIASAKADLGYMLSAADMVMIELNTKAGITC